MQSGIYTNMKAFWEDCPTP